MKLTVLVDNNTIDFAPPYLLAQSSLSFLIETEGKRILWDIGASDAATRNAQSLGLDLSTLDYLALSHGHSDHMWGIDPLIDLLGQDHKKEIKLIAHPLAFNRQRYFSSREEMLSKKKAWEKYFEVNYSLESVWLTDRLVFLGQIPRENDFEIYEPVFKIIDAEEKEVEDYILDDTALVYKSPEGLVVISGCAHAGICNTIEYAKQVCQDDRIVDVIGGFHLLGAKQALLKKTYSYIQKQNPVQVHACHCTDLAAKLKLDKYVDLKEVGSGLVLEYI